MVLRTILSALTIVLGALLIATWAVSQVAVNIVQDGRAATSITTALLDSPEAWVDVSGDLSAAAIDAIDDTGIDTGALGLDGVIEDQVSGLVHSEAFAAEAERQVTAAEGQFTAALTDAERPSGPLVLMMDASPLVNQRIDELPLVGSVVPDLTLAPIPVQIADADTIDDARAAYGLMELAATWFVWIGIALMVIGLTVSGRRRWFLAKTLLAVGVISLGVWALLTLASPDTIAGWLPGGSDSGVGAVVVQAFAAESAPPIAQRMLWWGVIALVGAAVFALVAAGTRPKKA